MHKAQYENESHLEIRQRLNFYIVDNIPLRQFGAGKIF